jgi:hypothetical protein
MSDLRMVPEYWPPSWWLLDMRYGRGTSHGIRGKAWARRRFHRFGGVSVEVRPSVRTPPSHESTALHRLPETKN